MKTPHFSSNKIPHHHHHLYNMDQEILNIFLKFLGFPIDPRTGNPKGNFTSKFTTMMNSTLNSSPWYNTIYWTMETIGIAIAFAIIILLLYRVTFFIIYYIYDHLIGNNSRISMLENTVGKMDRAIKRIIDDLKPFKSFQSKVNDSIKILNSDFDLMGTDIVKIFTDFDKEVDFKITNSNLSLVKTFDEKAFNIQNDLTKCIDTLSLLDFRVDEELDGLKVRMEDLEDTYSPDPNNLLPQLLGSQYPITLPAAQSVKEYVDNKVKSLTKAMHHYQQNNVSTRDITRIRSALDNIKSSIIPRQEYEELKEEMELYKLYVRQEYQDVMLKMEKEIEELKQKLKQLSVPVPSSPIPTPTANLNVVVTPTSPPSNPFLLQNVPASSPIPNVTNNNPAYQPEVTIIPPTMNVTPHNNTVIYQSVGNIPIPRFSPHLETPEFFLKEVELYMKRKRVMQDDWILLLPQIFAQDPNQTLWWQSTRLSVNNWEDFKAQFLLMFGSSMDKHTSLEKLLNRRQRNNESFTKFALQMNMQYRKIFELDPSADTQQVLQFIAERALPQLKTPLLSCRAANLVELINFGKLFENSIPKPSFEQKSSSPPPQHTKTANVDEKKNENKTSNQDKPSNPNTNNNQKKNEQKSTSSNKKCDYCPTLSNHNTRDCFKNKKNDKRDKREQHPPSTKVAQITTTDQGNEEEG